MLAKRVKHCINSNDIEYSVSPSEDYIVPKDVFPVTNTLDYSSISDDADALCPVCDDHCTCDARRSSKDYNLKSPFIDTISLPKMKSLPSSYIVFSSLRNDTRNPSLSDPEYCYYYTYSSNGEYSNMTSTSISCNENMSDYDSDVMLMTAATFLDEDCFVSELLADGEDPCDKIDGLLYSTESSFEDEPIELDCNCSNHIPTEEAGYIEDDEDGAFVQLEEQNDSENSEESSFLLSGFDKNPEKVKKSLYMVDKHLLLEALREMSPDLFLSISNSLSQSNNTKSNHPVSTSTPNHTNDTDSYAPSSPTRMISMEEVFYVDYDSDESNGEHELDQAEKDGIFRWDRIPIGAFRRRMSMGCTIDNRNINQGSVTPFKSTISSNDRDPWITAPKHKRRKDSQPTYYEQVTTWGPLRSPLFVNDHSYKKSDLLHIQKSWNSDTRQRKVGIFQKEENIDIEKEQYNSSSDQENEHDSHGDTCCLRVQIAN